MTPSGLLRSLLPRSLLGAAARCLAPLALSLLAAGAADAQGKAGKRLALVVGNGAYEAVAQLPNARNDADATAQLLAEARFDVTRATDASLAGLRAAIERFATSLDGAGSSAIAVVYYAGHAVQLHGNNHLLPVDVRPAAGSELPEQSVSLGEILKRLDRTGAAAKIVILDACRDNPFAAEIAPARGLAVALLDNPGKTEAGLARVESKGGTFVAFSTSPGTSAADGAGRHSPFTEALLQHAREPGVPVEAVFRNVRLSVHDATAGRQIPWETSSLTTPFSFFDQGAATSPTLELASVDAGTTTPRGTPAGLGAAPTRERLKALPSREAYGLVVAWDMPEYYRMFLEVYREDPLALHIHRILSVRLEEMSWAMAARWGDPAHLRRYAAIFEGSAHAGEARAMAAAGGAPGAKVCTPAQPKGVIEPPAAPVLRKVNLKQPAAKPAAKAAAVSAPRAAARAAAASPRAVRERPVETTVEEGEPYGFPPVAAPFNPGIFIGPRHHRDPRPYPPMGPGRGSRGGGYAEPTGPRGQPDYSSNFSPAFKQFIDAGRTSGVDARAGDELRARRPRPASEPDHADAAVHGQPGRCDADGPGPGILRRLRPEVRKAGGAPPVRRSAADAWSRRRRPVRAAPGR